MKTLTNKPINIADRFGDLINQSFQVYKEVMEVGLQNSNMNFLNPSNCDNCPPKDDCAPKFLGEIHRKAMSNERIIIPFILINNCSTPKTYRVGLREFSDLDGNTAPTQPNLNKNTVTIPPNGQERILIDLNLINYNIGFYQAEVVVREQDYNQNILLVVEVSNSGAPVFSPLDEKKYHLKWQNWKTHFYCEPKRRQNYNLTKDGN